MSNFGKYVFIWQVPTVLGGNPQEIGEAALDAGIQTLIVKFAQGRYVYIPSSDPDWGNNLKRKHVEIWQSMGLRVMGYIYMLGNNPTLEAEVAANEAVRLRLDGVSLDVEIEFETSEVVSLVAGKPRFVVQRSRGPLRTRLQAAVASISERVSVPATFLMKSTFEAQENPVGNAHAYMQRFKALAPGMQTVFVCFPLFRSPYSGGTWHNKAMYDAFMQHCNFAMPMCYWWGSSISNMLWMLNNTLTQWSEIAQGKPIVPIGRLYNGDGGTATAEAITSFGQELHNRGLIGGGGWRFGTGLANPLWWSAFTSWPAWQLEPPPPPPQTPFLELPEEERWKIVRDDLKNRGVITQ